MRWTPNTSCSPAATRKRTEAWNTPPIRTSKKEVNGEWDVKRDRPGAGPLPSPAAPPRGAATAGSVGAPSKLDVRRLDPLPEVGARRLLQLIRIHLRHIGDGREVVAVLVRR